MHDELTHKLYNEADHRTARTIFELWINITASVQSKSFESWI